MALDTPSIEELITARTEALHLEATGDISVVSDRTRHLLTDIAVLGYLQRGEEQIADYNATHATPWEHEFTPATNGDLWRFLHNTKAARFQRLFTPNALRRRPALPQGKLHQLSLDGFVVSPDRVPGILLVKTGLVREEELNGLNGDQVGRLIVKNDAIPSVKMLFESATALGPEQGRLLVINLPTEEIRARYPDATLPSPDAIGAILYVRGKLNGDKEADDLQVHFYDSSYDALRKTFHADSRYDGEIDGLAQCQRDLDGIRSKLDRGYKRDTPQSFKDQLWEQAQAAIARTHTILEHVQAPDKREALSFVDRAGEQRTKTGKPNVTPAMTQITAALARIDHRFMEIREKGGYNAKDRIILHENIRGDERTLLTARHEVIDLATDVGTGKVRPHDARRMLELHVKELGKLRVRPLSVFANAMIRHIQMLAPDRPNFFKEQLLRLHAIGKIQGIRTSAERIRGNAAKHGSIDFATEAETARSVEHAIRTEQIFPGMTVLDVEEVMEPIADRWTQIREFLEHCRTNHPEDLDETQEQLETLLDALGTENATLALSSWLPEAQDYEEPYSLTNTSKVLQ